MARTGSQRRLFLRPCQRWRCAYLPQLLNRQPEAGFFWCYAPASAGVFHFGSTSGVRGYSGLLRPSTRRSPLKSSPLK
jgi:hypothetical protein